MDNDFVKMKFLCNSQEKSNLKTKYNKTNFLFNFSVK